MAARSRYAWSAVILWAAIAAARAAEPPPAPAAPSDVAALARRWDRVNFAIKDPHLQAAEAEALARDADAVARAHPGQPAPLIWEAAALLSKADAQHNFGSLGLARRARRLLEQAIEDGAAGRDAAFAHAVLGELYGEMPGFPLGFGDRKKAVAEFAKAFAIAPDDVDVNVFYADFLLDQKDPQAAIEAAQRVLNAPPSPGREAGDKGRRDEARSVIAKAQRLSPRH